MVPIGVGHKDHVFDFLSDDGLFKIGKIKTGHRQIQFLPRIRARAQVAPRDLKAFNPNRKDSSLT